MIVGHIYHIKSTIDDRYYIGSTIRGINRFKDHVDDLASKSHCNIKLQNFYNKYGLDVLRFDLIGKYDICSKQEIRDIEQVYLDEAFKTEPQLLFNINKCAIAPDGEGEKNNNAILNSGDVINIIDDYINQISLQQISDHYHISVRQIKKIVLRIGWTHLDIGIEREDKLKSIKINNKNGVRFKNKLSIDIVKQILKLVITNQYSDHKIAQQFSIRQSTVHKIIHGDRWKDVTLDNKDDQVKLELVRSSSRIGKWAKGENNSMFGKKHSDESRKKISLTRANSKVASGENNPKAKLTVEQVKEIIDQLKNNVSQVDLANKYNVSKSTISSIKHKRTWSEIWES